MIRCCFLNSTLFNEPDLKNRLIDELEKLVALDDVIEFWVTRDRISFLDIFLESVIFLKNKYPDRYIKIVCVLDPNLNPPDETGYPTQLDLNIFSMFVVDKIVYSKKLNYELYKKRHRISEYSTKVERWIIEQCNYVLVYYYPMLQEGINKQVKFALTQPDTKVITVNFNETIKYIQYRMILFKDRTIKIFQMLSEGKNRNDIGRILGISNTRVREIIETSIQKIYEVTSHNPVRIFNSNLKKSNICGLAYLNKDPSEYNLTLFKSFIKHITNQCNILEFWLDIGSLDTPYRDIIAHHASQCSCKVVPKIFMPFQNKENELRKAFINHVPPFKNAIGVSYPHKNIYENFFENCRYFITDFTCEGSDSIRELGIKYNNIPVFNAECTDISVDCQYIDTI